jgi:tRNA pseudouridine38-40 synthase
MPRYFLEVSYKGSRYAGFQIQENANTVQAEVENALKVYFRQRFELTGSSRTDAGVHAFQNFFHFDQEVLLSDDILLNAPYHLNAILPDDIVIKSLKKVNDDFHCRFDALSREYQYCLYREKDPFMQDRGYFFPFRLDFGRMQEAAGEVMRHEYFAAFSKKHSQVKTFSCNVLRSEWRQEGQVLMYRVEANRFLRGMVRGLVGTMLRVGTGKLSVEDFGRLIEAGDQTKADFSAPPLGLFLVRVNFSTAGS